MKKTINFYEFERAFAGMDRKENFSYEGLKLLFEYLEEMEEDAGIEIELDVVGLCCEYSEYESLEEIAENYGIEGEEDEIEEYLMDHTDFVSKEFKTWEYGEKEDLCIIKNVFIVRDF